VLAVVARTFVSVATALILTKIINVWRCTIGIVGIHVPHNAIALVIGAPESIPQLGIRDRCVSLDNIVQGRLKLVARQSIGRVVIVGWWLSHSAYGQTKCEDKNKQTFHFYSD
jgi:hypothetical protein